MHKLFRRLALIPILLIACGYMPLATANELVIIANPDTKIEGISMTELYNIYMGITKSFSNGGRVRPVHQAKNQHARRVFFEKVLKKTESEVNRYWSRRKFSGKGTPPETLEDGKAVQKWVMETPGGLGYIEGRHVGRGVKVLLIIP